MDSSVGDSISKYPSTFSGVVSRGNCEKVALMTTDPPVSVVPWRLRRRNDGGCRKIAIISDNVQAVASRSWEHAVLALIACRKRDDTHGKDAKGFARHDSLHYYSRHARSRLSVTMSLVPAQSTLHNFV
ncbi:hypothetical protein X777_10597 [Ooceraea biroi]|uniref:Uncharacterized protein n=1 Tax=Ooceraea biroi TaxID=2015173 RepID=A0A026W7G1_OOCBI|nr:hypothetical protein X777_10597 [Ooceraea biroi]